MFRRSLFFVLLALCLAPLQSQAQQEEGTKAVLAMAEYSNTYTEAEATLRLCFLRVRHVQKLINAESAEDRPVFQKRLDAITGRVDVNWNSLRKNNTDFNIPGIAQYDAGLVAEFNGDVVLAVDLYTKARNNFLTGKAGLDRIVGKANSDLEELFYLACDILMN